jgi:dTDP-L-rhamnose 4-epimerase
MHADGDGQRRLTARPVSPFRKPVLGLPALAKRQPTGADAIRPAEPRRYAAPMRVLITGGAGFIGSHVADRLAADGHEIVLLDVLLPQAHGSRPPPWTGEHELVRGDVGDAELLRRLLPGVDAVCHQAAMVGHGIDPSDAPDYARHNDLGTAVLLAAMHEAGIGRLVLAGSMVVYGEGRYDCPEHGAVRPGPRDLDELAAGRFEPPCPECGRDLRPGLVGEDAAPDPRSTYAATKLAQEHLASAWARQTGGTVWALRYHNVYGPRMPRDTPYAGVASIFRSALERGEAPRVMEDGAQRRDFVHVSDVAAANVRALGTDRRGGTAEAINVCSGEPHTILDLATELAGAMDGPAPVIVGGARPGDVRHVVADPARARDRIGFQAAVRFADGVAAFATDPLRESAASISG